jgi:hypothetical protein
MTNACLTNSLPFSTNARDIAIEILNDPWHRDIASFNFIGFINPTLLVEVQSQINEIRQQRRSCNISTRS